MDRTLEAAINRNQISVVEELIKNGVDIQTGEPLIKCIRDRKLDIAKLLIEAGANTTKPDHNGWIPLLHGVYCEQLEMVKLLLDNGAEFTMQESLNPAIWCGSVEIVNEFIKRGVDVNRIDTSDSDRYAIISAVLYQKWDILKLLVKNGANVNAVDGHGNSPLLICSLTTDLNLDILNFLLENGADANAVDSNGDPLLIKCEAKSTDENWEKVKFLIKAGANINAVDRNGDTLLLHFAARTSRDLDDLKFLVENGANVNVVDRNGDSLLMKYVRKAYIPAVNYLMEKKADLNLKNAANETALSLALSNVDFRTFKFLIEAGADPRLAGEAIGAMAKKNSDFEAYMSRLETKRNSKSSQPKEVTGYEALGNKSIKRSQREGFAGHEAAPNE